MPDSGKVESKLSDQFYIRVRGRVQGPFDSEKLRQLARRGQFSRMHEISVDGQQWEPAKERPELFAPPAATANKVQKSTDGSINIMPDIPPIRGESMAAGGADGGQLVHHPIGAPLLPAMPPPPVRLAAMPVEVTNPTALKSSLVVYQPDEPQYFAQPTAQFHCPFCSSSTIPLVRSKVSTAGWITFVLLLLLFCWPFCWIGLLMREEYRQCSTCGMKIGG